MSATPSARLLADELDVDLSRVEGTGRDGRILKSDVQAAAEKAISSVRLSPEGQRIYDHVRAYLEEFDLWKEEVHDALNERYVRNLLRSRELRDQAEENPIVVGSTGQDVANPLFTVARNAELDAHKYAEALLLTPEALRRHLKGLDEEDDEDLGF